MTGPPGTAPAAGRRRIHLAVELPVTGWSVPGDPAPPPRPDFDTYARLARTAERGRFDFLLLSDRRTDSLARHPSTSSATSAHPSAPLADPALEPLTVLNALAAVTEHLGLAAAVTTAGREPYELARRIAALDQLSGGRAGGPAAVVPEFALPRSPQGRPVVLQDRDASTDSADSATADVLVGGPPPHQGRVHPDVRLFRRLSWQPDDADPPTAAPPAEQVTAGEVFTGSAGRLAARLDSLVRSGTVDGFVLRPAPVPGGRGLDLFVDQVVPLLQERGILRTAYRGTTLREHLGLPRPAWKA